MRTPLFVALILGISACNSVTYGVSAPYGTRQEAPISVVMPPNAPTITSQIRTLHDGLDSDLKTGDHQGIDIIEIVGTPVLAAAGGTVLRSFSDPMFGQQIIVDHGLDTKEVQMISKYRHLDARVVEAGASVRRGQQIGTLGTTGVMSQGVARLHFELWQTPANGHASPVDPHLFWLNGPGQVTCYESRLRNRGGADKLTYPVVCKSK